MNCITLNLHNNYHCYTPMLAYSKYFQIRLGSSTWKLNNQYHPLKTAYLYRNTTDMSTVYRCGNITFLTCFLSQVISPTVECSPPWVTATDATILNLYIGILTLSLTQQPNEVSFDQFSSV